MQNYKLQGWQCQYAWQCRSRTGTGAELARLPVKTDRCIVKLPSCIMVSEHLCACPGVTLRSRPGMPCRGDDVVPAWVQAGLTVCDVDLAPRVQLLPAASTQELIIAADSCQCIGQSPAKGAAATIDCRTTVQQLSDNSRGLKWNSAHAPGCRRLVSTRTWAALPSWAACCWPTGGPSPHPQLQPRSWWRARPHLQLPRSCWTHLPAGPRHPRYHQPAARRLQASCPEVVLVPG